jgi:hypothetical protein
MPSHSFATPPETLNHEGKPRHVGVEIEFGSVSTRAAAEKLHALFDGRLEQEDQHRFHLRGTSLGDFLIELDSQYVHRVPDAKGDDRDFAGRLRSILGNISELIVPNEIVCPPVELDRLAELEALTQALVDIGASGSSASPLYAFGCQLNPEIASREAGWILAMLRAYVLMSPWLRAIIELDLTRRLASFADPFPADYVRRILARDYAPDMDQLIDDYLAFNPTRNRELDMLPLFAWLDEQRVHASVDDVRIKARPTFHYRLPDARIGQPGWSLALEWNRWCVVERLAADADRLSAMSEAWLENDARLVPGNWAIMSTGWLLT